MCCLKTARLVMVDCLVLKPCCSLIITLFIKGVNLSLIILLNIFGIIEILDIGRKFEIEERSLFYKLQRFVLFSKQREMCLILGIC